LRTDNGGELTSTKFTDFCKEAGIKSEKRLPYNLQQNGVAERKNRSIISAAKAMFPWAEACNTIVYLQNKIPHRILEDKTPEEAFISKRPEIGHLMIGHLMIFSCEGFLRCLVL
jgi:transposase InsO family protein